MKCERCGKDFGNEIVEVCDECGYNFEEGKRIKKELHERPEKIVSEDKETDLIDYPILSFVFGIIGLIIPLIVFSLLAIWLGRKPAKIRLTPFSNLGFVFGIIGVGISIIFLIILAILFL